MRNQVKYEWCYETTDDNGDIIDSHFADKLSDFSVHEGSLVLVRNEGNDADGLLDRMWAYVKDDQLPSYFDDESGTQLTEYKIPIRFLKEFNTL